MSIELELSPDPMSEDPTEFWKRRAPSSTVMRFKTKTPKEAVPDDKASSIFLLFAFFHHILSRSFFAFQLQARIVCVSDTHSMTSHMGRSVPDGDILIHAGDFTRCGHLAEVRNKKEINK